MMVPGGQVGVRGHPVPPAAPLPRSYTVLYRTYCAPLLGTNLSGLFLFYGPKIRESAGEEDVVCPNVCFVRPREPFSIALSNPPKYTGIIVAVRNLGVIIYLVLVQ